MKITSRAEAKASGATRYFTGKPCKHGHVAERQLSNSTCFECMRLKHHASYHANVEVTRARRREYVAANRDKVLKINKASHARNSESVKNGKKAYYERVKTCEKWQSKQKALRTKNKDAKKVYDKKYRLGRALENSRNSKNWVARNPDKRRVISFNNKAKRRAVEKAGDPASVVFAWIVSQKKDCFWCGLNCHGKYHVDHFMPLARGGKHVV